MTKETADTTDLLRRFAEVIPSIPAKAVLLLCETTAAAIHLPVSQELPPEQPSPYGTVNAMGHKIYEGEVTALPGRVLRVQSVQLDRNNNVVVRIVDVHERALHSVLWATAAQHKTWRDRLDRVAAERRAGGYRAAPLLADADEPMFIHDEGGEHPEEADEDAVEEARREARAHGHPDDLAVDDGDADEPGEGASEIGGEDTSAKELLADLMQKYQALVFKKHFKGDVFSSADAKDLKAVSQQIEEVENALPEEREIVQARKHREQDVNNTIMRLRMLMDGGKQ